MNGTANQPPAKNPRFAGLGIHPSAAKRYFVASAPVSRAIHGMVRKSQKQCAIVLLPRTLLLVRRVLLVIVSRGGSQWTA